MKALSIRQPWAWLILHAGKDIENRHWPTPFRGRFQIHASKAMTRQEYAEAYLVAAQIIGENRLPRFEELQRGGIVGEVDLLDCVRVSNSRWFCGPWGFVLANPKPTPFVSCRGALGFFDACKVAGCQV